MQIDFRLLGFRFEKLLDIRGAFLIIYRRYFSTVVG